MKRILILIPAFVLFLCVRSRAIDALSIPTDYLTITSGTRANLAGNFSAIQTWGNKLGDSTAQVTARFSGYTGTLLMTSLSNMRLKIDSDVSETARFVIESGAGDSLFRIDEGYAAKFFGVTTFADSIKGARVKLTDSIIGTTGRFSGNFRVDSIVCSKFYADTTFTVTGTGFSGSVTANAYAVRVGKMVTLLVETISGTSNTTALTITGIPSGYQPTASYGNTVPIVKDNGTSYRGYVDVTSGTITPYFFTTATAAASNTYTASSTKGVPQFSITYQLRNCCP